MNAKQIAKRLIEIKAIALRNDPAQWFTWASGIKSPIYCDNRLVMSYPEIRSEIADAFAQKIREQYPDVEALVGTATAGIPHAAFVSERLGLPMLYVRSSAKTHGKTNQIEGLVKPGQKVVVIEDLISTGMSSVQAAKAVQEAGLEVQAVLAIFSYNLEKAKQQFAEAKLTFASLSDYDALIEVSREEAYLNEAQEKLLLEWRNQL